MAILTCDCIITDDPLECAVEVRTPGQPCLCLCHAVIGQLRMIQDLDRRLKAVKRTADSGPDPRLLAGEHGGVRY